MPCETADGDVYNLALDWITGNIYLDNQKGGILACGVTSTLNLTCATVVPGNFTNPVHNMALNPDTGYVGML